MKSSVVNPTSLYACEKVSTYMWDMIATVKGGREGLQMWLRCSDDDRGGAPVAPLVEALVERHVIEDATGEDPAGGSALVGHGNVAAERLL